MRVGVDGRSESSGDANLFSARELGLPSFAQSHALLAIRIVSALLTFAVAYVGVIMPLVCMRSRPVALSLARMLSVGVMLGGGLLHLLPDAASDVAEAGVEFPLAYLCFAIGLLMPLAVESLLLGHESPAQSWEGLPSKVTVDGLEMDEPHGPLRREMPFAPAMVLLLALSFHSVLEGLVAILTHTGRAALALGTTFLDARLSYRTIAILGLLFALATPFGILIGVFLGTAFGGLLAACLVAAAGGSFTFVALLEVLPRELSARGPPTIASKLGLLAVGFGMMTVLAAVV